MQREIIIIRFGELFLKGNNRAFFESLLLKNIRVAIASFGGASVVKGRGRYVVEGFNTADGNAVMDALKKVFGIHSLSFARETESDLDKIYELCRGLVRPGSFKVETKRADKTFPLTSQQVSAHIGGRVVAEFPGIAVDVHAPDYVINIDIRENGRTFVFCGIVPGAGGMPVGSSAKGVLMLSGGIDSPAAGFLMARRGMKICAVHYHSYPYTSEQARQKVISIAERLSPYCNGIKLFVVPFTAIQESIHKKCRAQYMITIMRRFMMEIAERIANEEGAGAIINGESLGQVASQTLESITVTGSVVRLPVLRPLIGLDKQDIINIANKIDTYSLSVLPYEDCCTVFLPKNPVIKPRLAEAQRQERELDKAALIEEAVRSAQILHL